MVRRPSRKRLRASVQGFESLSRRYFAVFLVGGYDYIEFQSFVEVKKRKREKIELISIIFIF
ncbi:hypothetical protein NPIRD3C_1541 [Nitrosopumilus piranensis]|uniref:Uncharacterized protein n=1 Tax=Nitrosopumilus piranensis TaxID=1582439 RepID=A0A0C5BSI6_9ARCH|nr:hypothetical protein NPIRD3C_1541 [Nitrosopumilus piranensis]